MRAAISRTYFFSLTRVGGEGWGEGASSVPLW
jgi:hypothetical protein